MIEAAAPKDEIEGALAVQMACTHMAAMAVLARLTASSRQPDPTHAASSGGSPASV
jgi:hypothetical protein